MYTKDGVTTKRTTKNLTMFAIFAALVIVLQSLATFVSPKIMGFSITLTLIPIVLCAILMGPKYGALLGGVFSVVVIFYCIIGADPGGEIMFYGKPVITCLVVLVKGTCAGLFAGLIYKAFSSKKKLATVLAAIIAPIANTGLFTIALPIFYYDLLVEWANGTAVLVYLFTGIVGINFLLELTINILLSPAILAVMKAIKKV